MLAQMRSDSLVALSTSPVKCQPVIGLMEKVKGFTLIEIMVALTILALSGVALLSSISHATNDLGKLNDKLVALNIAEYTLNSILLIEEFPDTRSEEEIVTQGGREWRVQVEISDTPNDFVRRIDVLIRPNERQYASRDEAATILLSGFRADIY